jgi:hypothetical protein
MIDAEISRWSGIGLANKKLIPDIIVGYLILLIHHIIVIRIVGSKTKLLTDISTPTYGVIQRIVSAC